MTDTKSPHPTTDSQSSPSADAIEQRVLALAEQLGRFVGAAQARTDGWLDRQALNEQLTRIRDSAAGLLGHLGEARSSRPAGRQTPAKAKAKPAARTARTPKSTAKSRSGGTVGAPGKAHRKAPAATRGVKHSDESIPKLKSARQTRRARRG
jgi:hypothetical protein